MPGVPPHLLAARAAVAGGAERFEDRAAAGRRLAAGLARFRGGPATALALTPGGVAVAGELAHALRIAVDVFVTREFRVRGRPSLVAGAVTEGGGLCLNAAALRVEGVAACDIWREAQRELAEVARLVPLYRGDRPPEVAARAPVILVDDGMGSGLAQLAAIRSLRRYHAQPVVVATPIACGAALELVGRWAESVHCLDPAEPGHDDPAERWIWPLGEDESAGLLARLRSAPL